MEHDDAPRGRVLTRRELVTLLGASSAALVSGAAFGAPWLLQHLSLPDCIARPQQTEGPYFSDERLNRSDIRSDPKSGAISAGVPLALGFVVSRMTRGRCEPLSGAQIDIWHCDALGNYSDVSDRRFDTVGQKFLRGYQVTDGAGHVAFQTIYPGWYPGRTVHVHFKVRVPAGAKRAAEFTSQLYFEDDLTDRVHARPPYSRKGQRTIQNADDGIFRQGGGQLVLAPRPVADGFDATFSLGLQLE